MAEIALAPLHVFGALYFLFVQFPWLIPVIIVIWAAYYIFLK